MYHYSSHVCSPLFSAFCLPQFVVIASTLTSAGLKYDEYTFPYWTNVLGWGVAMSSMLFVPFYAIYKFFSVSGTFKEVCIRKDLTFSFDYVFKRCILWAYNLYIFKSIYYIIRGLHNMRAQPTSLVSTGLRKMYLVSTKQEETNLVSCRGLETLGLHMHGAPLM